MFVIQAFRDSNSANIEIKALLKASAADSAVSISPNAARVNLRMLEKTLQNRLVHMHSKWFVPPCILLIWPSFPNLKSSKVTSLNVPGDMLR